MEALVTSFAAALAAEWGDKTQLLAIALAARFARPAPIIAGIALAALANSLIAGIGGSLIHDMIPLRAISLFVGIALVFTGGSAMLRAKAPDVGTKWRTGPFLTALGAFFLVELGDKTQFTTAAFAAQFDAPLLAAAGATAGIILASIPAVVAGPALAKAVPLRGLRLGIGIAFLVVGLGVGLSALRLV